MHLTINPEFKNLLPILSDDEYTQLEENVLNDGIRDPLVVWDDVLIDGHNRYEIAQKHNIEFEVFERDFESIEEAKIWMIDNQKGKRNLSDFVQFELMELKSELLKLKGRASMSLGGQQGLSIIDKPSEQHNTRKEIANDLGWSTGKVAMANVVKNKADEQTIEKVRSGETSINQAYQKISREQKAKDGLKILQKLQKKREKIEYEITQVEQLLESELNCFKITDKCYLVGEGNVSQIYKHLLNNLKL